MTSYSHRNGDLDVRVHQSNALDDADENLNRALIDQQTTSSTSGGHGYSGHGRGNDNDADVDQDIDSGDNRQNNDLRINDPEARDDLTLDIGQSNSMYDDDRNTNYANIEQSVAQSGGSHHGRGGSSGDNDADVEQDIDSGGNHQKNFATIDDARAGDDLRLDLDQSNSMDDGDRNGNFTDITQELASSGGGSHSYGGHGGHGGSADNDADVDQDVDSGGNRQNNFADLDNLNARGDLDLKVGQTNTMYDDDVNTNGASIDQRGGNNWADLDQSIDSGGNSQQNNADFDPSSGSYASRGGHGSSHGGNNGDDVFIDLSQRNTMDDGDDNMNDAEIVQVGGRNADNDADVWQKIESGDNNQKNHADMDNIGVRGDLDVKVGQTNTMHDDDLNTNGADIDQRSGDNWADLDQKIDSGGNSQNNNVDFDPSGGGTSYARGGGHGGGGYGGSDDTEVDVVQRNTMDDGDDNLNTADITQAGSRGADNDADVWQNINSGGNSQNNYADLDLSSRGAAGEYDVEQVNWMADDDVNTNHAGITQQSADNWADADQAIDSGGNTQHNSLDLDFG
jgi:hypothetical protein